MTTVYFHHTTAPPPPRSTVPLTVDPYVALPSLVTPPPPLCVDTCELPNQWPPKDDEFIVALPEECRCGKHY